MLQGAILGAGLAFESQRPSWTRSSLAARTHTPPDMRWPPPHGAEHSDSADSCHTNDDDDDDDVDGEDDEQLASSPPHTPQRSTDSTESSKRSHPTD